MLHNEVSSVPPLAEGYIFRVKCIKLTWPEFPGLKAGGIRRTAFFPRTPAEFWSTVRPVVGRASVCWRLFVAEIFIVSVPFVRPLKIPEGNLPDTARRRNGGARHWSRRRRKKRKRGWIRQGTRWQLPQKWTFTQWSGVSHVRGHTKAKLLTRSCTAHRNHC